MLRPLTRKRDTITVVHPLDEAIDRTQLPESGDEPTWWDRYCACESLDTSRLPLLAGVVATELEVRGLTEVEALVVRTLALPAVDGKPDTSDRQRLIQTTVQAAIQAVCFGLQAVRNLPDWDPSARRRVNGLWQWDAEAVGALPGDVLMWLYQVVMSLTNLDSEKKRHSGASPTIPGGTNGHGAKTDAGSPGPSLPAGARTSPSSQG